MSRSLDPATRQAFITGLRDLADYLDTHPAVAVPPYGIQINVTARSADDGGCAQVNRFARHLGAAIADDLAGSGHYAAARAFGPVSYSMAAISGYAMARHHAEESYRGCIAPDPGTWT